VARFCCAPAAVRPLATIYCGRLLSTAGRGAAILLPAVRRVRLCHVYIAITTSCSSLWRCGHSLPFTVAACCRPQDKVVRFYCERCEACVCVMCTFNEHRDHDIMQFCVCGGGAATRYHLL